MIRKSLTGAGMALSLLAVVSSAVADHLRNVQPGEPLPPFQCRTLDGGQLASKDVAGRVLVLVYVSAGQEQSDSALAAAHKVVTGINNEGLVLVFMSADVDRLEKLRETRQVAGIQEPLLLDEGRKYYGQLGLITFPTTIVTSKTGELSHVISSWRRNYEHHLELYCRHALGELDDAALAAGLTEGPAFRDEASSKANRHRSMAEMLRSKGMIAEAVRELEKSLELDPDNADSQLELAELLVAQGQLDQAQQRVAGLLARKPDQHGVRLVQGLISLRRGDLDQAEELLTEELKLNPDPARAHYLLGQVYEQKGECQAAMEHYRDALKSVLKEP